MLQMRHEIVHNFKNTIKNYAELLSLVSNTFLYLTLAYHLAFFIAEFKKKEFSMEDIGGMEGIFGIRIENLEKIFQRRISQS